MISLLVVLHSIPVVNFQKKHFAIDYCSLNLRLRAFSSQKEADTTTIISLLKR